MYVYTVYICIYTSVIYTHTVYTTYTVYTIYTICIICVYTYVYIYIYIYTHYQDFSQDFAAARRGPGSRKDFDLGEFGDVLRSTVS